MIDRIKTELRNIPENLFTTHDVVDKEHIANILDIMYDKATITSLRSMWNKFQYVFLTSRRTPKIWTFNFTAA